MNDDYGSGNDDYGNALDEDDNLQERFSDDSRSEADYSGQSEHEDIAERNSINEEEDPEQSMVSQSSQQHNYDIIQEDTKQQPNEKRITSPFMTKFEKAKIIGIRAVQISKNAPLYLKNENIANMNWDPITIAEKELAEKKIPFIIRRYLPNGQYEDWKLSQLRTFD